MQKFGLAVTTLLALAGLTLTGACSSDTAKDEASDEESSTPLPERGAGTHHVVNELRGLPRGDEQNARFCAEPLNEQYNDRVRNTFCSGAFPEIRGLADLFKALGVTDNIGRDSRFGLALAAHSSSISTRSVSSINPRVFVFTQAFFEGFQDAPDDDRGEIAISYTRGEPYIELVAEHRGRSGPGAQHHNFYLIKFDKACEASDSCDAADFYTDEFEENWERISIYEDLDLRNTTLDCMGCHQPASADGRKIWLFAESQLDPTHWFDPDVGNPIFDENPRRHYNTFYDFHGEGNGYGVISADDFEHAEGEALWSGMYFSGSPDLQPIEFEGRKIQGELRNTGTSETWNQLYNAFVTGQTNPPPHFAAAVESPERIAELKAAYEAYRKGDLSREDLPDLRRALDPDKARAMGLGVKEGLDPEAMLVNACAQCHTEATAAGTAKAKFLVDDVSALTREQKDVAIQRLRAPDHDPGRMPPIRFRSFTEPELEQVIGYLAKD